MPVKNETSTHFMDEVRIISPWAYFFAVLGFLAVIAAITVAIVIDKNPTPPPVVLMAPMGIFAGAVLACYILLIGYINRDAGRRGMSRLLWTVVAIIIPNALGIVLYFILRKPRAASCPQCSAVVEPGFGFCPRCRYRLTPVCPQCQRSVHAGDKFCPYCGSDLASAGSAPSNVLSPTQV